MEVQTVEVQKNKKSNQADLVIFYKKFKEYQENKKYEELKSIWTNKILVFLKKLAIDNKVEVRIENEGTSIVYWFGEMSVKLKVNFYNLSVGSQDSGSFYVVMSKRDFEENSWFRKAYESNKVTLKLE